MLICSCLEVPEMEGVLWTTTTTSCRSTLLPFQLVPCETWLSAPYSQLTQTPTRSTTWSWRNCILWRSLLRPLTSWTVATGSCFSMAADCPTGLEFLDRDCALRHQRPLSQDTCLEKVSTSLT